MTTRPMIALAPLAAVAACATHPGSTPAAPLRCDAAAAQSFVGQPATQELGSRMLAATGASTLRWVRHGAMVTMEFVEGRLTVRLDPQGRVASAACT